MHEKLKTLVLDPAKWARGCKNGPSSLLNTKGTMCCLGFLGKALGAGDTQILKRDMPYDTGPYGKYWSNLANIPWPEALMGAGADDLSAEIAEINDDMPELKDRARVNRLQPEFKKIGYRVVLKRT